MKQALAGLLYVSFLLLALRVHAATPTASAAAVDVGTHIERANIALARYRATAQEPFIEQAQAAVTAALALAPDDYVAQRTAAAVLLARHADRVALARVTALNRRFPDDVDTYALLIDAELALGLYAQAEQDTQRLLDLRPDNLPGLVRAARLRELYGDWQGAIDFVNASLTRTPEDEAEQRASLFTQLARLQSGAGHDDIAVQALAAALLAEPDYGPALEERLRVARLKGAHAQALQTAQQLYRAAPSAAHLFMLARATAQSGDGPRAADLYREFVGAAQRITQRDDNANLALSAYYADEGRDVMQAVTLAAAAHAARADVTTLLAEAWALHRAGRDADAQRALDTLTKLGWRDPEFLAVTAQIHTALASASTANY